MKTLIKGICFLLILGFIGGGVGLFIIGMDIDAPDTSQLIPEKLAAPEEKNVYFPLKTITDGLQQTDVLVLKKYVAGNFDQDKIIKRTIDKNAAVFERIDKALVRERCILPGTDNSVYLNKLYSAAMMVAADSLYDLEHNQIGNSLQKCVSILHLGSVVYSDSQSVMNYDIGIGIATLGLEQAERIVYAKSASQIDLERLADALIKLKPFEKGLIRAFKTDFKNVAYDIDGFRSKKETLEQTFGNTTNLPYILSRITWFPGYVFMENRTKQTLTTLYEDMVNNVPRYYSDMVFYDIDQFLGLSNNWLGFLIRPNVVGRMFYAFAIPEFNRFLEHKCRMESMIRALRLIMALRKYNKDTGELPDELVLLSPDYIEKVPLDPFDGKPFRYSRPAAVIYSVGKDLRDSGGSVELRPDEIFGKDVRNFWTTKDAVFEIFPQKVR